MRCVALVLAATLAGVPARARPTDWTVRRDPFDRGVIGRYKAILARDPYDAARTPVIATYLKYRTLAVLDSEYGEEDWAALAIRARIARGSGDDARALALWTRATAIDKHDARGWLAVGELAANRDDAV